MFKADMYTFQEKIVPSFPRRLDLARRLDRKVLSSRRRMLVLNNTLGCVSISNVINYRLFIDLNFIGKLLTFARVKAAIMTKNQANNSLNLPQPYFD